MFDLIVHFIAVYVIGFYLITTLQWYSYKLNRIIFHFHKYRWHIFYFVIPVITYMVAYRFYWIYLFFGLIPALVFWVKKINKPLNITQRVKRFFIILGFIETLNLVFMNKVHYNPGVALFVVLLLALFISDFVEHMMFLKFKQQAKDRLKKINPKIVSITASYGKTSIKNFIYKLLEDDFKVYRTPRSVNTLKGIVLDVNRDLPQNTEIYITEAGAREKGDIKEIVEFLENEYSILGKIGPQHIEYFKTMENIIKTKCEIMHSKIKKGFSYEETCNKQNVIIIKDKIRNIKSSLNGIEWDLEIDDKVYHFKAPILGEFNTLNISLAIYQALEFTDIDKIISKVSKLEPIPHRLQKIEVGGKVIIDDSFNGNIEGMISSYDLVKKFSGRKVIVTPGIIEGTKEMNEKIAKKIDEVFDIAIITGKTNKKTLCDNITIEKIILNDKKNLEKILADITKAGDLILFSNDFPEYL